MTEIHVRKFTKVPHEVSAVVWTGDAAEGRLLHAHKWVEGMDLGMSLDGGGPSVLRGLIGGQIAFPSDVIVRDENGALNVFAATVFGRLYELVGDAIVLSDGEEPRSPVLDSDIPTGINPNAVNLDVDPDIINRLSMEDTLRELAAHADDGDERSEDRLSEALKQSGWDPDSDESPTWTEMIQKVIDSKITIEFPEEEAIVESTPDL